MALCLRLGVVCILFGMLSCGGGSSNRNSVMPPANSPSGAAPVATSATICDCTPGEPASTDFRDAEKHVGLPSSSGQDVTVATVLGWATGPEPAFDAPRTGVETQMFHIAQAYLQFVTIVPGDCDIHMEISDNPSKTAPRMIVETPVDSEFCPARQNVVTGLARFNVQVTTAGMETPQGIAVDVLGLAFRDFNHQRGTPLVATPWEIHPAIVTIK